MKTLKEFVENEQSNINESFESLDFFDKKFVDDFIERMNQIWDDGSNSDVCTALFTLLNELGQQNPPMKLGIIDACEEILTRKFKR